MAGFVILGSPPTQNNIVDQKKMEPQFRSYFTNLSATVQSTILPTSYTSAITGVTAPGVLLQHPVYQQTSEINSMSPPDGTSVYDAEAKKFNFRVNGAWVVWP